MLTKNNMNCKGVAISPLTCITVKVVSTSTGVPTSSHNVDTTADTGSPLASDATRSLSL